MPREFLLPDPGEGIHEAEILEIHVTAGDEVKDGDPLFEVETDKAITEVPSSFDGRIVDVRVEVGEMVEVGSVLLTFEPAMEDESGGGGEGAGEEDSGGIPGETRRGGAARRKASTDTIGSDGRPVPASPATRSLAKRLGVNLVAIEGSGPEGRVEPEDVKAAADQELPDLGERALHTEPQEAEEAPDLERFGPVEWVEMRGVRRATARQMARSWNRIPHVTHNDVADITGLESFRRTYAPEVEAEGGKLTITPFLVKAAVAALKEHPRFNASLDEGNDRLAVKEYYNIGVAVDTEDGLVVPVIREADQRSLVELAVELTRLAERMRQGDRSLDDMQGGTFTITNPGGIGGTGFSPIVNHPEVAILGAARAHWVPVVGDIDPVDETDREFEILPRLHLPLVLAFDHRVNDGADAARFLNTVIGLLEDFPRFMLSA